MTADQKDIAGQTAATTATTATTATSGTDAWPGAAAYALAVGGTAPQPGDVTGVPHPTWMDPLLAACTEGSFDGLLPKRRPPEDRGPNEVGRPHRYAAVLVLFSGFADAPGPQPPKDARVLLTHRAPTLSSHSGQVSFPGGGVDDTDTGPIEAAMREAWEETGLDPESVDVLAVLPELYIPVSNYSVAPVIGYWREPMEVGVVDPGETSRVMTVPVSDLLDPSNRFLLRHTTGWTGPAFQLDDLVLWGFTAGIIAAMFNSAGWDLDWDTSDIRDLESTLAASGNGERHSMSAEEARREHSDPLADRTVAGVPGARSGHEDQDVRGGAGQTGAAESGSAAGSDNDDDNDDGEARVSGAVAVAVAASGFAFDPNFDAGSGPGSDAGADSSSATGADFDEQSGEESLDLPADNPRRGYR